MRQSQAIVFRGFVLLFDLGIRTSLVQSGVATDGSGSSFLDFTAEKCLRRIGTMQAMLGLIASLLVGCLFELVQTRKVLNKLLDVAQGRKV
jgi:hypothetical protein